MQSNVSNKDVLAAIGNSDYQRIVNKVIKGSINRPIDKEETKSITDEILWESLKNFKSNRGMKFTSYLYQTARFKIHKLHRSDFKNRQSPRKVIKESDIIRSHFYKVIADDILDALKSTDQRAYDLLVYKFYYGMTYKEIGLKLGLSKQQARTLVKKAIEACRELCIVD